MKEATERYVEWAETTEGTFGRFAQFVYTDDYDGYEGVSPKDNERLPDPGPPIKKARCLTWPPRISLPGKFIHMYYNRGTCVWLEDWTESPEALLAHAHMYTFADYHGIKKLQMLAIRKLHRLLVKIPLEKSFLTTRPFVELALYTYQNTRPDANDKLRSVVSMYGACLIKLFLTDKDLNDLLVAMSDLKDEVVTMLDVV